MAFDPQTPSPPRQGQVWAAPTVFRRCSAQRAPPSATPSPTTSPPIAATPAEGTTPRAPTPRVTATPSTRAGLRAEWAGGAGRAQRADRRAAAVVHCGQACGSGPG